MPPCNIHHGETHPGLALSQHPQEAALPWGAQEGCHWLREALCWELWGLGIWFLPTALMASEPPNSTLNYSPPLVPGSAVPVLTEASDRRS